MIKREKSPEVNEWFIDDFAVTVPDTRCITEVLQLTLATDLNLGRRFNEIVTTTADQLI